MNERPDLAAQLDLRMVSAILRHQARQALTAGDGRRFVGYVDNHRALVLVFHNVRVLQAVGIYESALLEALTGTRTNHRGWSLDVLHWLLNEADPERLRAAGDPLPGPGPFTLYRGVLGRGAARKVRGIHWTATASTAAWFAARFAGCECGIDPAVFVATVPASAVRAYVSDRGEDDYLVVLPPRPPAAAAAHAAGADPAQSTEGLGMRRLSSTPVRRPARDTDVAAEGAAVTERLDVALPTVEQIATMSDAEMRTLLVALAGYEQAIAALHTAIAAQLGVTNGHVDDRLLTVEEAAEVLHVTPDWLRRQRSMPFRVEVSEGQVRYSAEGIQAYIRARSG